MPRIFVAGSLNVDFILPVDRLPVPGETRRGGDLVLAPGGKGANQACAAGRLGGSVEMVGQVGNDVFSGLLRDSLRQCGVLLAGVGEAAGATGCASIYVTPDGQNSIVISPGANASLDPAVAVERLQGIQASDFLLLQLEIPLGTNLAAALHARRIGARVILDPAPSQKLPPELLAAVDILTPNETEASDLLGPRPEEHLDDLLRMGVGTVVLKLGERGCIAATSDQRLRLPAFAVQPVDTTAAGDVFNGALAVALSEGAALPEALRFANAAAAISVTRLGAQPSIPSRAEVDSLLRSQPY